MNPSVLADNLPRVEVDLGNREHEEKRGVEQTGMRGL
jgi:hypothetical protein